MAINPYASTTTHESGSPAKPSFFFLSLGVTISCGVVSAWIAYEASIKLRASDGICFFSCMASFLAFVPILGITVADRDGLNIVRMLLLVCLCVSIVLASSLILHAPPKPGGSSSPQMKVIFLPMLACVVTAIFGVGYLVVRKQMGKKVK